MKKIIISALLGVLLLNAPAHAQEAPAADIAPPIVVVVDIQKILRDCNASKGVREQLATKRDGYQKEIVAGEKALHDEQQTLMKGRGDMTEAQFNEKRKAFEDKVKKMNEKVQSRARVLDAAMNDALGQIKQTAGQIVSDAAATRKANLVLDKGQVVVVESSLDLTKEVMDTLNAKMPKVDVKFTEPKA